MTTEYENLKINLKKLNLNTVINIFEEEAKKAIKLKMSYIEYLAHVIESEILIKTDRSVQRKIANAHFPFIKTIEEFDFKFQPIIDEREIKQFCTLSFIDKAEGILFVGPPGVGKTHLTVAVGIKACMARKRVLFFKTNKLVEILLAYFVTNSLEKYLELLSNNDLIIVD